MPTTTAVFNRTLTNLGPLTTTFTPAPACTELVSQSKAGMIFCDHVYDGRVERGRQQLIYGDVACTPQDLASCYPNGKERQSILATGYEYTQMYNSPGYHCPAGWSAVASATYTAALSEATRMGADLPSGYDLMAEGLALYALGPTETMTVCCPSGYTPFAGDFEVQVGCTSVMGPASSYGVSERCFNDRPTTTAEFEFFNRVVTKIEPVSGAPTTYTQLPLVTDVCTDFMIVHTMPNIVLVNGGPADSTATATATPTTTSKDGGKDGKDGKKSAAVRHGTNLSIAVAASILFATATIFWI